MSFYFVLGSKFHFQRCLGWILLLCGLPLFCFQVSKIRLSWSKFSRSSFYTRRKIGKCSKPDSFFHYSSHSGMMGNHLAIELHRLKQAPKFPILQVSLLFSVSFVWRCALDTWLGFLKCLARTSRTSRRLKSGPGRGMIVGRSGPGSWHVSGCQRHLLWVKSEHQQIVHVCFGLPCWAGSCGSLRH